MNESHVCSSSVLWNLKFHYSLALGIWPMVLFAKKGRPFEQPLSAIFRSYCAGVVTFGRSTLISEPVLFAANGNTCNA